MPRHVPKPAKFLVELDKFVNDRAVQLGGLSLEELTRLPTGKLDDLVIEARRTIIFVEIETLPCGNVSVLVEGRMQGLHLPHSWNLNHHGFFRHPDSSTTPMSREDRLYLSLHYWRKNGTLSSF